MRLSTIASMILRSTEDIAIILTSSGAGHSDFILESSINLVAWASSGIILLMRQSLTMSSRFWANSAIFVFWFPDYSAEYWLITFTI